MVKSKAKLGQKRPAQDENPDLQEAIEYFLDEDSNVRVRGNLRLQLSLDVIQALATDVGLQPVDLLKVFTAAKSGLFSELNYLVKTTKNHVITAVSITTRLVKCLIPNSVVPSELVLKVVSWICTNKPSHSLQALLIQWLVLVYDCVEDHDILHSLYGLIFHFLQSATMCPHVCKLLCLMTRKEDVRMFRIHELLQLQKQMGSKRHLLGLLVVYKTHCPSLVQVSLGNTRIRTFFPAGHSKWEVNVRSVLSRQEKQAGEPNLTSNMARLSFTLSTSAPVSKRRQSDVTPAKPPTKQDFNNIDTIEIPSHTAEFMDRVELQTVLLCHPSPQLAIRLQYWLDATLTEEFFYRSRTSSRRQEQLLLQLVDLHEHLGESVPVVERFLARYLHTWDGRQHRAALFTLLTGLRIMAFTDFYECYLEPLRKLFCCSDVYFKVMVVVLLTLLIENWGRVEIPRVQYTSSLENDSRGHNCMSVFEENSDNFSAHDTTWRTIQFVNSLFSVSLPGEKYHKLLINSGINFFNVVCELKARCGVPLLVLPASCLVYGALFANCPLSLNNMCLLLCRYREGYHQMKQPEPEEDQHLRQLRLSQIEQAKTLLNSFILVFVNCLWRKRLLDMEMCKLLFPDVSPPVLPGQHHDDQLHALSLPHHPALRGYATRYINKIQSERHKTIDHIQRDKMLVFLESHGLKGISDFISLNIRTSTTTTQSN